MRLILGLAYFLIADNNPSINKGAPDTIVMGIKMLLMVLRIADLQVVSTSGGTTGGSTTGGTTTAELQVEVLYNRRTTGGSSGNGMGWTSPRLGNMMSGTQEIISNGTCKTKKSKSIPFDQCPGTDCTDYGELGGGSAGYWIFILQ